VKRNFRLTKSTDYKRVRQYGKSHAHPLLVLVALPVEQSTTQLAVSAGRSVGNAVQRNRAKRLIREALRLHLPAIAPGWHVLLIARRPIVEAAFSEVQAALLQLLHRAKLLQLDG
jgi:ribonuclease P protein component